MFAFGFVSGVAFVLLVAGYAVATDGRKKGTKTIKRAEPVNPWDVKL